MQKTKYMINLRNPNMYCYRNFGDLLGHSMTLEEQGKVVKYTWMKCHPDGKTYYFCEYKEVSKA